MSDEDKKLEMFQIQSEEKIPSVVKKASELVKAISSSGTVFDFFSPEEWDWDRPYQNEKLSHLSLPVMWRDFLRTNRTRFGMVPEIIESELIELIMTTSTTSGSRANQVNQFLKIIDVDIEKVVKDFESYLLRFDQAKDEELKKHAEGPKDGPFGYLAFRDQRVDDVLPYEANSVIEDQIFNAIDRYINDNTPWNPGLNSVLKHQLAAGNYKKFLRKPDQDAVYRGMTVSSTWLEGALNSTDLPDKGTREASFTLQPKNRAGTSWTKNYSLARDFSISAVGVEPGVEFEVILTAKTRDNDNKMLDLEGGFYSLTSLNNYAFEKEVMGLGDIKVSKIEWKKR